MTEITERITPEMSEEEVLGVILDEILERAEPDVTEAVRFCAIPHWFNVEIIAWLRSEGLKPSQRSREILAALTELTFVGPYYERGWAYHENVRDLLLRRWRERDGEEFKELSGRAAEYFGQKAEAATDEERDEWARELMYHLLTADPEQGVKLFRSMFNRARDFYQLSTCALLLELAKEQEAHLSAEDRLWLRFRQGQLADASAQWLEALSIFEGLWKEELPLSLEGVLANDLGTLHHDKGEWERAIEYHERSLAVAQKVGDEYAVARTLNNLGSVYQGKGEWERAIESYERSQAILKKVGDEHRMATIFNNLGEIYRVKKEWERAIEYHERSLAILKKVGDEHGTAISYSNLGNVYQGKGEWERAIEYYGRSLAIKEKVGDEHGMAPTLNNLGTVYKDKGEWERAIEYYGRSLAILEKVGDEVGAATTMYNIASLYEDMDRYDEAIELLERVVEIDERLGHRDLESDREALERVKRKAKQ
jgi:tetratricopeptide (TPR) repeat protein